jgi:hypothetical protein
VTAVSGGRPDFDSLVAAATSRESIKPSDSKSAASFERLLIQGDRYLVKLLSDDWLAAGSLDDDARAVSLWESGVYDGLSDIVDSTVVSASRLGNAHGFPAALLMHDVSDSLVEVDGQVDSDTHAAFLDAMAAMHARHWGSPPDADLMPFIGTYLFLSPNQARIEAEQLGDRSDVLRAVTAGWASLADRDPELMALVVPLLNDPKPLVEALDATPVTFLHGDWKMGNLGRHPDGRVVLLDWDRAAAGPATADLAWYLAVNSDRLPESKDAAVVRYRSALEAVGVSTTGWWSRQVTLTLLGGFLQLGWSKVDQPDELAWWRRRVRDGVAVLAAPG